MKPRWKLLICCILTANALIAQSSIQKAIEQLANDATLKHGQLSVQVVEVESGNTIASLNASKSVIPASTLKVLTTASALALFGPEYRFKTHLSYDGTITDQGQLDGNLIIEGFGDPTLGSSQYKETPNLNAVLEAFRVAVQQKGVSQINGSIIGDASYFSTHVNAPTWQWTDLGNYYASGAWGLNIHENLYYLDFQQKSTLGSTPSILRTRPKINNLTFTNELQSAGRNTGDNAYIYGAPLTYLRHVRGTIPIGSNTFTIKGSIPNPPLFFAESLTQSFKRIGIGVKDAPQFALTKTGKQQLGIQSPKHLYTHQSPKLSSIIVRTNMKSVNLYCESFLKLIGKEKGAGGTFKDGLETIKKYWEARGVDFSGCHLKDGSGLSPRNLITATMLTQLLQIVAKDQELYQTFKNSLPVAGQSGSLKGMFRGTSAVGKIHAKSGTLGGVRSYAGYAKAANGKLLAFTIVANNFEGSGSNMRRKLETVMRSFVQ